MLLRIAWKVLVLMKKAVQLRFQVVWKQICIHHCMFHNLWCGGGGDSSSDSGL